MEKGDVIRATLVMFAGQARMADILRDDFIKEHLEGALEEVKQLETLLKLEKATHELTAESEEKLININRQNKLLKDDAELVFAIKSILKEEDNGMLTELLKRELLYYGIEESEE